MALMSIGAVAKKAGIQPSAIRYYEGLGLLPAPEREGGKRRYDHQTVMRLRAIHLFKQAGFSMADLQVLLRSEPWPDQERFDELASNKLRELELLEAKLQVMREVLESVRRCGCLRLEECGLLTEL